MAVDTWCRLDFSAIRIEHSFLRWRRFAELGGGAYRSRHQVAAAVGASAAQHCFYAFDAESAFKTANARVGGIRRQVAVATFTIRAKFQHGHILEVKYIKFVCKDNSLRQNGKSGVRHNADILGHHECICSDIVATVQYTLDIISLLLPGYS
jgi:hypothetical protein